MICNIPQPPLALILLFSSSSVTHRGGYHAWLVSLTCWNKHFRSTRESDPILSGLVTSLSLHICCSQVIRNSPAIKELVAFCGPTWADFQLSPVSSGKRTMSSRPSLLKYQEGQKNNNYIYNHQPGKQSAIFKGFTLESKKEVLWCFFVWCWECTDGISVQSAS